MRNSRESFRSEAGSAYIVTLLALVVLTILALTLTLVTQSELQIGGSEKTVNRLFYSADAMISLGAPKVLNRLPRGATTMILNRVQIGSGATSSNTGDRVTLFNPPVISWGPANLSMAALGAGQQLYQVTSSIEARSERITWRGNSIPVDTTTPVEVLGSKRLVMELINTVSPQSPDVLDYKKLTSNQTSGFAPPPVP